MNYAAEVWTKVLSLMAGDGEGKLSQTTINAWFDDAKPVSLDEKSFVLCSPTPFKRDLIAKRYLPHIAAALKELFSAEMEVRIIGEEELEQAETGGDDFLPGTEEYTFDKFVVGSSNKYAYTAAQAVAENPGTKGYNPLFIYGASGLGKTHLLYAIAHAVHRKFPQHRIVYIKGDAFTNELVNAIQRRQNQEFRDKYRSADVLLMDDVQFIAGKDYSQEEMFHTFNSLYEAGHQIVFTADRPPKEMSRLDERLQTRFSWGLPVDIQPPDYETRMAIIKNKAIRRGVDLPDPVLRYIADNITSNVRQIEGTVNKILAFHELMGEEIDVDTVSRAVRDMFKEKSEFLPTVDEIIEEVAKFYNIDPKDIRGQARTRNIMRARQVAMYEIRRMTNLSQDSIGKEFGGRDHTTVKHSIEQVEKLIKTDPGMAEVIKDINANINARYE